MATSADTVRRYYCHRCDMELPLRPPSSLDEDVVCPLCNSGFIEELPDRNPNPNPSSTDPFRSFDLRHPNDLSEFLGATSPLSSSSSPATAPPFAMSGSDAFDPFAFLHSHLQSLLTGGASIQIVVDRSGGAGMGMGMGMAMGPGMGGSMGDYFFGSGLEQLIQQLAENDPNRYGSPPAAKSVVAALPDVTITPDHLKTDSASSVQCSVCMDNFEAGIVAKQLPCKHLFHKDCILQEWVADFGPDVVTYNTLINACFDWQNGSGARKLLDEMRERGIRPTLVTHNIMVKGMCKAESLEDALNYLRNMEKEGLSGDCITYNTLINAFANDGNASKAFALMDEMVGKGIKMDTFTLNTVLKSLCKEKRFDEACELLRSPPKRGFVPDEVSFGTVISAYFRDKNPTEAAKLWEEMLEKKIKPKTITYNTMIKGLCTLEKVDDAIGMLNEMVEKGLIPDETTYNIIINGYCRKGDLESAFQFHNKMVTNSFRPNVVTCNILLDGLCKHDKIDKAMKLFESWVSKGKKVDVVSYNTLINASCRHGEIDQALGLFRDMKEKGIHPDAYTYNAILCSLTEADRSDEANDLLKEFSERKDLKGDLSFSFPKEDTVQTCTSEERHSVEADLSTYSEQINALCKKGHFKEAKAILDDVVERGMVLDSSIYVTLMDGLIKRQKRLTKAPE